MSKLRPAINGVEARLDVVVKQLDRLNANMETLIQLLDPKPPASDGKTALKEPAKAKPATKTKRTTRKRSTKAKTTKAS